LRQQGGGGGDSLLREAGARLQCDVTRHVALTLRRQRRLLLLLAGAHLFTHDVAAKKTARLLHCPQRIA